MYQTVFLNAAKLDFDNKLDFTPLSNITAFTKYDSSSYQEVLERVNGCQIIITKELPLGKDLITQFPPSVQMICEAGTGYNNIDITAARAKSIAVCNVPGYSTEAVAQLAVTFMLNLSSSMILQQMMIREKDYSNFTRCLQTPHLELLHKTLGIIGYGAIGRQVAKIASALGMNILVYTRTPKPGNETGIRFTGLDELLRQSDFVTIHCPLTSDTQYLIGREQLKLMKPSAFIINTSRGAVIKETDLIEALRNGTVSGAALDVQETEPLSPDNPLFLMKNVVLTPHIGWKCLESRQRLINELAVNIESFINGHPVHVVN